MSTPQRATRRRKHAKKQPHTHEDNAAFLDTATCDSEENSEEDEVKSLHSDALDDESDGENTRTRKRKRSSPQPGTSNKKLPKKSAPRKTNKKVTEADDGLSAECATSSLKDGQEIVGAVVQAPKTGWVPEGQISQNTFDFLSKLKDPVCNDREWFKLNEPVYRHAEKEWKDFIDVLTGVLINVDSQIPPLPPKDVIHRIYRDVRFSNDKTPYKKGFSASFSRSGRKGIFAVYHVLIKPGNESLIAAGCWCPGKNEFSTIRSHILHSPNRLREILSNATFVEHFGEAIPHPDGKRQNIFGMEDELKVAPKGIDKKHKDIDLLKCRTFAVSYKFTDNEVLAPDFKEELGRIASVMQPLVHCLNDMITLPVTETSDSSDIEDDEGHE